MKLEDIIEDVKLELERQKYEPNTEKYFNWKADNISVVQNCKLWTIKNISVVLKFKELSELISQKKLDDTTKQFDYNNLIKVNSIFNFQFWKRFQSLYGEHCYHVSTGSVLTKKDFIPDHSIYDFVGEHIMTAVIVNAGEWVDFSKKEIKVHCNTQTIIGIKDAEIKAKAIDEIRKWKIEKFL